eukprot:g2289.t1
MHAYKHDGSLVTAGDDLVRWSLKDGGKFIEAMSCPRRCVDFLVIGSTTNNRVELFCPNSGRIVSTFDAHGDKINAAVATRDGTRLFTASDDRTAIAWDIHTGTPALVFTGHAGRVKSVDVASGDKYLLTGSSDRTAIVWDVTSGDEISKLVGHAGSVNAARFVNGKRRAITASSDGTTILWRIPDGTRIRTFYGHASKVNCICISPNAKYFATGSEDSTAIVWDMRFPKVVRRRFALAMAFNRIHADATRQRCRRQPISNGCRPVRETIRRIVNADHLVPHILSYTGAPPKDAVTYHVMKLEREWGLIRGESRHLPPAKDRMTLIKAVPGLPRCIGVPSLEKAKEWGCPVINVTTSDGSLMEKTCDACQTPATIKIGCLGQGMTNSTARDGTPVTFSHPVDMKSVKAENFVWHFSDGSSSHAECAIRNGGPAVEANEQQTIAIIGDAGGWSDKTITRLEIQGPLMLVLENGTKVSAEGLSYSGSSLVWENGATLLDARLETFTTKGETTSNLARAKVYPNHCHVNFPSATHRIRLLWDGGVSLDGANPITPDRVDLFNIRDEQGVLLPNESILGLADLGSESIPSSAADRS